MNGNRLIVGIVLTVFAGTVFSAMDAGAKYLTLHLPVLQVVWGRYVFQTLLMSGYLAATTGPRFLKTRRPVLHLLRGMTLLGATLLMYIGLSRVSLADATSVMFFSPIIITILSVLFLKETIGLHRILAVVAGFLGVLLIVRPGASGTDPYLFFPLAAAVLNAVYMLLTRQLAGSDEAPATQFNTTAVGALILTVLVVPQWQTPSATHFALLVFVGCVGAIGHFSLVVGFRYASASLLSPFLYSQVLSATAISLLLFGDHLRWTTLVGTAILIASGLYIWWRENRRVLPAVVETTDP
ncbi:DMT family transporter [Aureimonas sp. Leaf454]|uniref:DMT family transporter n=1 Tax=Aureimonas sp. Leaf454 TaxID=1736381 RepID=UPI001FCCF188|nr:DMT family transporter [Aureimonas sp. Leaf454]